MPPFDKARRDEIEQSMSDEVARLNVRTRRQLLRLLGDPPQLDNLTDDVWQSIIRDFENVLTPNMEKIFIESAQYLSTELGFSGVDFDLVNQGAVDWSRRYSGQTAQNMIRFRRKKLGEWVAQFYEDKIDRDTLMQRASRLYGPAKAEEIAITEVTRAAVEGERVVIDALGNEGVMMQKIWVTVRDRRVCPICEPLDGVRASGIGFDAFFLNPGNNRQYLNPPAHTRCRCGVRYEYVNEIR